MKNLTDFRKTVETGVDPRLTFRHIAVHISFTRQILLNKVQKNQNPARYQLRYDVYTSLC